jgi:hypothetical protein
LVRRSERVEGAPPEATVRGWVRDNREGFATQYETARRLQADAWADELVLLSNRDDLDPQDKRVRSAWSRWLDFRSASARSR